jgi:hypothetical protein
MSMKFEVGAIRDKEMLAQLPVAYKRAFMRAARLCRDGTEWRSVLDSIHRATEQTIEADISRLEAMSNRIQQERRRDFERILLAMYRAANQVAFQGPLEVIAGRIATCDEPLRNQFLATMAECANDPEFLRTMNRGLGLSPVEHLGTQGSLYVIRNTLRHFSIRCHEQAVAAMSNA